MKHSGTQELLVKLPLSSHPIPLILRLCYHDEERKLGLNPFITSLHESVPLEHIMLLYVKTCGI